jgi:hypothetical protein
MISSLYIVFTLRKKLHGSADFWAGISGASADGTYDGFRSSVVDVSEIPSEERDRRFDVDGFLHAL